MPNQETVLVRPGVVRTRNGERRIPGDLHLRGAPCPAIAQDKALRRHLRIPAEIDLRRADRKPSGVIHGLHVSGEDVCSGGATVRDARERYRAARELHQSARGRYRAREPCRELSLVLRRGREIPLISVVVADALGQDRAVRGERLLHALRFFEGERGVIEEGVGADREVRTGRKCHRVPLAIHPQRRTRCRRSRERGICLEHNLGDVRCRWSRGGNAVPIRPGEVLPRGVAQDLCADNLPEGKIRHIAPFSVARLRKRDGNLRLRARARHHRLRPILERIQPHLDAVGIVRSVQKRDRRARSRNRAVEVVRQPRPIETQGQVARAEEQDLVGLQIGVRDRERGIALHREHHLRARRRLRLGSHRAIGEAPRPGFAPRAITRDRARIDIVGRRARPR